MDNIKMTDEERLEFLKDEEGVIDKIKQENEIGGVEGLFAAAEDAEEKIYPIDVVRNGKKYFTFHVRPLPISQFERIEKANRVYEEKKGIKRAVDFKNETFLAMLVFEATTPEDKKALWNSQETKQRWGTIGHQTVTKALKAGEIESIAEYIEKISGRENELELGETVKN